MSGHAVPFYCPYCGEEDIVPAETESGGEGHGQWACRSCLRGFRLRLTALVAESVTIPDTERRSSEQHTEAANGTAVTPSEAQDLKAVEENR